MKTVKFGSYVKTITPKTKIQTKKFLESGQYPIISQESGRVNGYWDSSGDVMHFEKPVIVFGDHTRIIKFIDFDFVAGADGTKILLPPDDIESKYFYYWMLANPVEHLGYARHFRLLKEKWVSIPSLEEQLRVVERLDSAFEKIDEAIELTERSKEHVDSLYESEFSKTFISLNDYGREYIKNIARTGSGGTPNKSHPEYYKNGTIPWLRSGEVNKKEIIKSEVYINETGLRNSSAKIFPKDSILVAMYGATAGQVGILKFEAATNQAVCAIYPDDAVDPEYIYYALLSQKKSLLSQAVGNAQPNVSQIKIKNLMIPLLPLPMQNEVARKLSAIDELTDGLKKTYEIKRTMLHSLKQSMLTQAFSQHEVE